MARRARRGLAELSDSEGDECVYQKTNPKTENPVSLFETRVFTEKVLNKIRDEEAKVMDSQVFDMTGPNGQVSADEGSPAIASTKRRRRSTVLKPSKRSKVAHVLDDDDDVEDEITELLKSTSDIETSTGEQQMNGKIIFSDDEKAGAETQEGNRSDKEDEESCLESFSDAEGDLEAGDQNDYRVLVKHLGVDERIWVRLKEEETMQKVFDETRNAIGVNVTLMIDVNGEREEVLPTQTASDLQMSVQRCAIIYSYPVSEPLEPEAFKLRIVTTNRRATQEIECTVEETFADIFFRYCERNNTPRASIVFKFDGEVLVDTQTPKDLDMVSGEQIEAHSVTDRSSGANAEVMKEADAEVAEEANTS